MTESNQNKYNIRRLRIQKAIISDGDELLMRYKAESLRIGIFYC